MWDDSEEISRSTVNLPVEHGTSPGARRERIARSTVRERPLSQDKARYMTLANVSFCSALRYWLRLGFISFGGPAGQIALMHRELVEERRWLSDARFLHALNYCMLLPGPEAQQLATYIGWLLHGTRGGIAAGVLFILPSLLLLIGMSLIYVRFGAVPAIAAIFAGLKPAVLALVVDAALRLGRRTLGRALHRVIAVAACLAIVLLDAPFPLIIGFAACAGAAGNWRSAQGAPIELAPADPPTRAGRPDSYLLLISGAGLALWLLPFAVLVAWHGPHSQFVQSAWFFTKAALLTFGGAYAVLPYLYQRVVVDFGWLSAAQMLDGLALGKSTPGPLTIVVAFVGFVAGYESGPLAPMSALISGSVGAMVATWFTFLPSFLFILVGAPLIEATHDRPRLTAPLAGVRAAVVGVITSLAWFLAGHTLWPGGSITVFACVIAAGAFAALRIFHWQALPVLAASAVCGLVAYLAG
jgi:chromate transporter